MKINLHLHFLILPFWGKPPRSPEEARKRREVREKFMRLGKEFEGAVRKVICEK